VANFSPLLREYVTFVTLRLKAARSLHQSPDG
jgi:hypothetical protein